MEEHLRVASEPQAYRSLSPIAQADPLSSRLAFLSLAQLEWLCDGKHLHPHATSPLAFLRQPQRRTSLRQRDRAGEQLLANDPWYPGRRLEAQRLTFSPLGYALRILEAPSARLRLAVSRPGSSPAIRQLYVRGSFGICARVDLEGVEVGEPFRIASLLTFLLDQLASPGLPVDLEARCLMPEVFELATTLWKRLERTADQPIRRSEVQALFGDSPSLQRDTSELLDAMKTASLLETTANDEELWLHRDLRPWLGLVWSGHVVEIERLNLTANEWTGGEPDASAIERLLFAGPLGQRILCEDLPDPAGFPVLLFSRPTAAELSQRLCHLLRGASDEVAPGDATRAQTGSTSFGWTAGVEVN